MASKEKTGDGSIQHIARDSALGFVASIGVGVLTSLLLVMLVLLLLMSGNAQANSLPADYVKLSDLRQGSLVFQSDKTQYYLQAPTLKTRVAIKVTGLLVRTKVEQSFRNSSDRWQEGIYVFPLPENAAVDQMRMVIGDRIIEGQIKERQEAKKTYEKAKQAGKKTALLEQERPNLFTASVANIAPGETINIEIEFQQLLNYQHSSERGRFELRFPMTITPRYIPGRMQQTITSFDGTGWSENTTAVPDASRITPPMEEADDAGSTFTNTIELSMALNAGFPIENLQSPYHEIDVTFLSQEEANISLNNSNIPADRDFVMSWETAIGAAPQAALFTETLQGENYHLLMLMPPSQSVSGSQPLAKETIYVIDTSGSMQGESIVQAKKALLLALERLRPRDLFNVIQFNSTTDLLFHKPKPATRNNLSVAKHYVRSLTANGGTEMLSALKAALLPAQDEHYLRQIIFMTDGSIGNESQLFELLHRSLGENRLFTIGIGSAPNSHFMSKAAQYGRGSFTYIGNTNEVQEKLNILFEKLDSPVLGNLKISWQSGANVEYFPNRLPDLYLGQPIIIAAKTLDQNKTVSISGTRVNQTWSAEFTLQDRNIGGIGINAGTGVAKLWARKKIESLMDAMIEDHNKQILQQQIVNIGLQHHLVSKFTSLVAVDVTPIRPNNELLEKHILKNRLPQGMRTQKVFGRLARTATPAQIYIVVGFLLLGLAFLITLIPNNWRWHQKVYEA